MPKCVNHVLGIICKLSVDKLNRVNCMPFRAPPADDRFAVAPLLNQKIAQLRVGQVAAIDPLECAVLFQPVER